MEFEKVKSDKHVFVKIPLYCPSNFKSRSKIDAFFPPISWKSQFMPVVEKKFPRNYIQLHIRPWAESPKYEYIICLKYKKIPISFGEVHSHQCLIQFLRDNHEITANLYVKMN